MLLLSLSCTKPFEINEISLGEILEPLKTGGKKWTGDGCGSLQIPDTFILIHVGRTNQQKRVIQAMSAFWKILVGGDKVCFLCQTLWRETLKLCEGSLAAATPRVSGEFMNPPAALTNVKVAFQLWL